MCRHCGGHVLPLGFRKCRRRLLQFGQHACRVLHVPRQRHKPIQEMLDTSLLRLEQGRVVRAEDKLLSNEVLHIGHVQQQHASGHIYGHKL